VWLPTYHCGEALMFVYDFFYIGLMLCKSKWRCRSPIRKAHLIVCL